ncbi:uncharacterized protein LOC132098526 [Carassius carassius]|uniref:uncharacterized protein LOC132098526 n=1 Tax=Carassius carassius TaxID=217509 RepID=UPI0028684FA4|nr:uncharacterized protein LOC132098526 [Carassius carassius]
MEAMRSMKDRGGKMSGGKGLQLHDVLCGISGEHLEAFRGFLDKVEQIQPQAGVWAPKGRSRQQKLYPGSGLFLSSTNLAAIHATAKKDCLCLFRLLFDEFFTAEECQNAVAFGKHGKVPDGKRVLDKFKVNAILTYVMRCSTLDGWTPVEKRNAASGPQHYKYRMGHTETFVEAAIRVPVEDGSMEETVEDTREETVENPLETGKKRGLSLVHMG